MRTQDKSFPKIREFLLKNSNAIQKRATQHHKVLLGGDRFRTEILEKYQENHIKVVKQLAEHLGSTQMVKDSAVFKNLGITLGKDSVRDKLTIEEATDGIVFLKQSVWESLHKAGLLKPLTVDEFYIITQSTGTYVDVVVSKIAFTYHQHYSDRKEKQEKQKNEFIGLISHELKTPITSVKAFTQSLQKRFAKAGDMKSAMLLKKMDAQLNKLTGLIGDLLDVTKIETGKLQFHKDYFDLNELVDEIAEQMQLTTEKHTLVVKLDKTKSLYGDRDRIGQVLINLLTNAIKYSPHADKIIISTKIQKDDAKVCIQDFGIGIPKDAQDKVFDQFYRVSGRDEQTYAGMGLGLYVSAEIIRRHKGKIWVESEKEKGSTFCFTLPSKP